MRIHVWIAVASVLLLTLVSSTLPQPARAVVQAPTFSSSYTPLTKFGSGMTKQEEREAEQRVGAHAFVCMGPAEYNVDISYCACSSSFSIVKGEENISLGTQAIACKQKTAERRLANG